MTEQQPEPKEDLDGVEPPENQEGDQDTGETPIPDLDNDPEA